MLIDQPASCFLRKKRASHTLSRLEEKRLLDQRNREGTTQTAQNRSDQISENSESLRNFGCFYPAKYDDAGIDGCHLTDLSDDSCIARCLLRWPASCDINQEARSSIADGDRKI